MGEPFRDAHGPGRRRGPALHGMLALPGLAPVLMPVLLPVLAIVLVACGGGSASTSRPPASASPAQSSEPAPASSEGQPGPAAGTAPAGEPGAGAEEAVTEAECQALLAHVVEVANRAHAETVTPETAPTDAQLADIRARMAPEFIPMCLGQSRTIFACQMRASTRDQLLACSM